MAAAVPSPQPKPAAAARADGRLDLAGGAWRLQRDSQVKAEGDVVSKPGYADSDWLVATVPGTVLTSYLNVGAIPDPNFGNNQNMISDSFFYADFWYRNEFVAAPAAPGKHVWLNFDGINWKADIFLNGKKLGRIEGGFMRGRFDVTSLLRPGKKNALAIRIEKNATPGSVHEKNSQSPDKNGGALGADNPTFHSSVGWDWIPTIRGRNTGIWNNVYLTTTGAVTVEDPFVQTSLPLARHFERGRKGGSHAAQPGRASPFPARCAAISATRRSSCPSPLDASSSKTVKLDPSTAPALHLQNPKLWWPAGYGDPNLYPVEAEIRDREEGCLRLRNRS